MVKVDKLSNMIGTKNTYILEFIDLTIVYHFPLSTLVIC
jgi:hypothetical protein